MSDAGAPSFRRAARADVRVASGLRSGGLGRRLIEWSIARAGEHGCARVLLTADTQRPDAIRP